MALGYAIGTCPGLGDAYDCAELECIILVASSPLLKGIWGT